MRGEGRVSCHAGCMPRHTCHGHATPHEQKVRKRKGKKRSKQGGAQSIHSFFMSARRVSKGKVHMTSFTSASLFVETLDPSQLSAGFSDRVRRVFFFFDETRREPKRSWDYNTCNEGIHPTWRSPFSLRRWTMSNLFFFWRGKDQERVKGTNEVHFLSCSIKLVYLVKWV